MVLSDDLNGIVDALDALEVPTLLLGAAADLDDSYAQLETLGDATGHADEAADVIADMQDRIKAAVASVPDDVEGMRVYHELDPTFFSAAQQHVHRRHLLALRPGEHRRRRRRRRRRLPAAVRRVHRRPGARS